MSDERNEFKLSPKLLLQMENIVLRQRLAEDNYHAAKQEANLLRALWVKDFESELGVKLGNKPWEVDFQGGLLKLIQEDA